uniref:RRM domain-containing protein n=1 Tax=Ananas comosus var. bracteatus TaxID=296719 RepID=A0A6V7QC58_ANACO|nr:unnamed protein product [Ananas comosus var. bracteatus]
MSFGVGTRNDVLLHGSRRSRSERRLQRRRRSTRHPCRRRRRRRQGSRRDPATAGAGSGDADAGPRWAAGFPVLRPHHDPSAFHIGAHHFARGGEELVRSAAAAAGGGGHRSIGAEAAGGDGFKREMRDLEELLSKLNPMAEEFVPPSLVSSHQHGAGGGAGFFSDGFKINSGLGNGGVGGRRKKNGYGQWNRRTNSRTSLAQREEAIRRTVYVSDIDQQVTEEQLAALFINCGQVVDCRVCGDPNSVLRFAFIEFTDEDGARAALNLSGTVLGYYPVRVLPSKTAIAPVNPTFLPRSDDEREMCARTIYCTNIDKKVSQADVKLFFESICGEVYRLRLLGDYHHSTRIAFVEFVLAESATAALNCSGAILGSLR